MPARVEVQKDGLDTSWEDVRGDLQSICRRHFKGLHVLVVNRADRGPASGPLKSKIWCEPDDGENTDELVASLVDEALNIIRRDSLRPRGRDTPNAGRIGSWSGSVAFFAKDEKKPLDVYEIHIEDPSVVATMESEVVAMMKEFRLLFGGINSGLVSIYSALGKREKQQAKLFGAVAKSQSKLSKNGAKYKYKAQREHEETEREDIGARERTAKRKFFWSAVESIGVEWKDVGEIWSKYYTLGRKPGDPPQKPPQKPTTEECAKVFASDDIFEKPYNTSEYGEVSIRAIAAQMIAEPDFTRRQLLAKALTEIGKQIPDVKTKLGNALIAALGPERALEVVAWFSLPVTF